MSFAIAVLVLPGVSTNGWAAFLESTSFFLIVWLAAGVVVGVIAPSIPIAFRIRRKYGNEGLPPRYFLEMTDLRWWTIWIAWKVWEVFIVTGVLVAVEHVVGGFKISGLPALVGAAVLIALVGEIIDPDRLRLYTRVTTVQFSVSAVLLVFLIGAIKEHSL